MYYFYVKVIGGATLGWAKGDTFKEACQKLGVDESICQVLKVTNA